MEVWQMAMKLCSDVYNLTNQTNGFDRDFGLRDQVRRSTISIPSNIAEGFDREGIRQFAYFLMVAKGSAGELKTQILIAENLGYIDNKQKENISESIESISKQIRGLIKYLNKKSEK